MRTIVCRVLMSVLIAGLVSLPASAAQQQPIAAVTQAQDATLDGQAAITGASIYAGETLSTGAGGSLRATIGTGQLSLRPASSVTLQQSDDSLQLSLTSGAVAFSLPASNQFEVETPVGTVRSVGDSGMASAEITIASSTEIIISAIAGDFEIDRPCEKHVIHAGSTYSASLEADTGKSSKCADKFSPAVNQHLVVKLVAAGVVALAAILIYSHASESPSTMK